MDAAAWIRVLALEPHPEGGWFRETYRASGEIPEGVLRDQRPGARAFSTAIYFLLEKGKPSLLHRIHSDELWHFYEGDPVTVTCFGESGTCQRHRLGREMQGGESFQVLIPAGTWFGAEGGNGAAGYSLAGCTVAPGFDFRDFEMAKRGDLLGEYPGFRQHIEDLTRE